MGEVIGLNGQLLDTAQNLPSHKAGNQLDERFTLHDLITKKADPALIVRRLDAEIRRSIDSLTAQLD